MHQGRIELSSKPGEGSTFTVWLNVSAEAFPEKSLLMDDKQTVPLEHYQFAATQVMPETVTSEMATVKNDRHTLLIVDDNADLLNFMTELFAKKYNVLTATNGVEALQVAQEHQVQIVISDIMMPQMDGNELCRHLKESMETSHIPVILLTAKSESDDVVAGYKSGADLYVTKPFDPTILELQVNNLIQRIESRRAEIAEGHEEDVEASSLTNLDKKFIAKMNKLVDDNINNSDFAIIDITKELGVSRTLLHIKMKSLFDMSMGDYIRKKRLDKACQMLRQGHNVSETAYATGFSDPNWFSKTFKKHLGLTPSEYINKLRS